MALRESEFRVLRPTKVHCNPGTFGTSRREYNLVTNIYLVRILLFAASSCPCQVKDFARKPGYLPQDTSPNKRLGELSKSQPPLASHGLYAGLLPAASSHHARIRHPRPETQSAAT